jgi:hypothetical protein
LLTKLFGFVGINLLKLGPISKCPNLPWFYTIF